jgi:hypothetical protein
VFVQLARPATPASGRDRPASVPDRNPGSDIGR